MLDQIFHHLLDRYHSTKLEELDWITRNRLQMKSTLPKIEDSHHQLAQKPDRLKILFWGVMPWERGGVEHMFATSLRARGHQVYGTSCSGGMSACSMESILYPRPSCHECVNRHKKLLSIWGLEKFYKPTSDYLSSQEIDEIVREVDQIEDKNLIHFEYVGLPIGKLAHKDLPQFFFRLVDDTDPEVLKFLRRSIKGISQYAKAASNCLNTIQPDRAVVTSGRTIAYTAFYQLCLQKGIHVVTWDESVGGLGAFIFAKNNIAVNYEKAGVWDRIAQEPLTEKEIKFNQFYFKNTAKGKFGRHVYYNDPIENQESIIKTLHLDPQKPLTVCLTNLTWDTSALGKDIAFDSMIDWLIKTIEHFEFKKYQQLVIRTHPAEGHLESYARGCESVTNILKARFPQLPDHIKIVSGQEEISSHQLAEMAQHIAVYTTSVGLEMAMRGREVLVMAQSHYRGKGFTRDIQTRQEYFSILDQAKGPAATISESQMALAQKYAYYFIVRTEAYLEEFNIKDRHQYLITDPNAFMPGKSQRWDNLCQHIELCGDFIDCTEFIDPWQKA